MNKRYGWEGMANSTSKVSGGGARGERGASAVIEPEEWWHPGGLGGLGWVAGERARLMRSRVRIAVWEDGLPVW